MVVDRRCGPAPPRPEHDIEHCDRRDHRPDDEAETEPGKHRQPGNVLGHPDRERVQEGPGEPGAGADQRDRPGGDLVVTQSPGKHHQSGQEDEGLLGHADGRSAQGEENDQHRDDDLAVPAAGAHDAVDQGLDGAGGVDDAEGAADEEDVEHDVGGFHQALRKSQKDLCKTGRTGLHRVVGLRDDELAALVVDTIERARRDPVSRDRGEHDQPEEQREGVGHLQLHEVRPQNSTAAIA